MLDTTTPWPLVEQQDAHPDVGLILFGIPFKIYETHRPRAKNIGVCQLYGAKRGENGTKRQEMRILKKAPALRGGGLDKAGA